MDKVYIVTGGSYSDYSIYRAFINKEDAEEYRDKRSRAERVEEYDLHASTDEVPYVWMIIIDAEGEVLYSDKSYDDDHNRRANIQKWPHKYYDDPGPRYVAFGETEEHARRSAEDLRREHKAHGGG